MGLNSVILQGRVASDIRLRTIGEDVQVADFRIAVDRNRVNKETGERESDFFTVNAWRGTAKFVGQYFAKGDPIIVQGALRARDWIDDQGQKRTFIEVAADNIYFGGPKKGAAEEPEAPVPKKSRPVANHAYAVIDDGDGDLPF